MTDPAAGPARPFSLWREDLIAALCGTGMMFGLFLDGWNHINLQNGALGSFFTPWHAALYAGFGATALWVMTRNPHLYLRGKQPKPELHELFGIPLRYPFAVAGIAVATVGLVGDAIWHTVFGEETGVARVIAPFHLLLFAGAGALLAAPLRSAWHAPEHYPARLSFRNVLPPLIALTMPTALVTLDRLPPGFAAHVTVRGTLEFADSGRIVVTSLLLMAPVLLALRRWRLPFGGATFLFTSVAVMMAGLAEYRLGWTIAAAAGGRARRRRHDPLPRPSPARPTTYRVIAVVTPLALWLAYFLVLMSAYDVHWPTDLWLGVSSLAGLTGGMLSFLTVPPAVGSEVWIPADEEQPPDAVGALTLSS